MPLDSQREIIKIELEWKLVLEDVFKTDSFSNLSAFVINEYVNKQIFPAPENLFKAFWLTPFSKIKVVILGQDPYHGPKQAHGLCFSVPDKIPLPPSLKNIYKEIETDLGIKKDFSSGNLEDWAKQGVFLLNAILTVISGQAASHRNQGWEEFTDSVIKIISEKKEGVVFMLWGNYARSKKNLIDSKKHLILEAPHPSPLSAYAGFFGSKHFSQTNDYLSKNDKRIINW
jgi:uracil-DNA glycosylase